ALPEEQVRAQPFAVDLDVEADLAAAGRSDDLSDTVDYGALAALVVRVIEEEHCVLLERLAERIADAVRADERVRSVTVVVRQLLGACHRLEAAAGRVRGERWGPRTLDVDILLFNGCTLDEPDLTIPHPRMYQRRFVMAPLADVAPDVVPEHWELGVEGSAWR